jgi:biopolymer transport protein ExbB
MKRTTIFRILCSVLFLVALVSYGQDVLPADAPTSAVEKMSLTDVIETGGWLMYVLAAMSVVALAFVVYFLVLLRQEQVIPAGFVQILREKMNSGQWETARTLCENNRSAVASIARSGLAYLHRNSPPDPSVLKEIIEGEGGRQAALIQNQIQYLLDIAVIAPMVGLLGTVMGMLTAFNAVALDIAKAKPMVLAAGVSQALVTTAAGLIVGIPAMIFYAYFRGRTVKMITRLESVSADMLAAMCHVSSGEREDRS